MRKPHKRHERDKGLSLLELVVASGMMATILATVGSTFKVMTTNKRNMTISATRDNLVTGFLTKAGSDELLATSRARPENASIRACLDGPLQGDLNDCLHNTALPVTLQNNPSSDVFASGIVPVRYNLEGARCAGPADQVCVFEAAAFMVARCQEPTACSPPLPPTSNCCRVAETVAFDFTVTQAAGIEIEGTPRLVPRRTRALAAYQGPVFEIEKQCSPGETYEGNDQYGNPVCTVYVHGDCPPNYFLYRFDQNKNEAAGSFCRSYDTSCPMNEIYQGSIGGGGWCITYTNDDCGADPDTHVTQVNFNTRSITCARRVWPACGPSEYLQVNASGDVYCTGLPPQPAGLVARVNNFKADTCRLRPNGTLGARGVAVSGFNPDGTLRCFAPSDPDNDGDTDYVVGVREGGGPHVMVFDGWFGTAMASFFAYDPNFRGGVAVGMVDVNKDGRAEIITLPGPGGGPQLGFWDLSGGSLGAVWAYPNSDLRLGHDIGN